MLYEAKISGERLQDRWSSDLNVSFSGLNYSDGWRELLFLLSISRGFVVFCAKESHLPPGS